MPYSARPARRRGCILLAVLAAGVPALAIGWIVGTPYTSTLPRAFDSARWQAADADGNTRCGMLADLTYRVGVEGKSRAEIIRMLGKPDDKGGDPMWSYWLLCPSFMDVYILEIRWDKERAASATVRDT